jgi:hypothetical protein
MLVEIRARHRVRTEARRLTLGLQLPSPLTHGQQQLSTLSRISLTLASLPVNSWVTVAESPQAPSTMLHMGSAITTPGRQRRGAVF